MNILQKTPILAVVILLGAVSADAAKVFYADYTEEGAIRCYDTVTFQDRLILGALAVDIPYYVAVHPTLGKVYWSEPFRNRIRRADLDGTNIETVVTWPPGSCQLEYGVLNVDDVNDQLYWTEEDELWRADLDGSNQTLVYDAPSSIWAFDVQALDFSIYIGTSGTHPNYIGAVIRIDLDGAQANTLDSSVPEGVFGIAADSHNGMLYYVYNDGAPEVGHIDSLDLYSHDVNVVVDEIDANVLKFDEQTGQLYWSLWYRSTAGNILGIARSNADGSELEILPIAGEIPFGIDVVYLPEPECPEDLNGDGVINIADLAALLAHYGDASGALPEHGDVNGDGAVNIADLAQLLARYGQSCE